MSSAGVPWLLSAGGRGGERQRHCREAPFIAVMLSYLKGVHSSMQGGPGLVGGRGGGPRLPRGDIEGKE